MLLTLTLGAALATSVALVGTAREAQAAFPEKVVFVFGDAGAVARARQQLEEEKIKLGAAEAPEGLDSMLGATVDRAIDEAYVAGYRAVMLVAAAMSLASAVSAGLLIEGERSEKVEGVHAGEEVPRRVAPQP